MRVGKLGVYSSHAKVPLPDSSDFGFMYKFSGDGKVYLKTSDGISTLVGGGNVASGQTYYGGVDEAASLPIVPSKILSLDGVNKILGNLTYPENDYPESGRLLSISFPDAIEFEGGLQVDGAPIGSVISDVSFPALVSYKGASLDSGMYISFVDCPELWNAIECNAFPLLETLSYYPGYEFQLMRFVQLNASSIVLPSLTTIKAESLDSTIAESYFIGVEACPLVESFSAPELTNTDENTFIGIIAFSANDLLNSVNLPKLKTGGIASVLLFAANPVLSNISLPELESYGVVFIQMDALVSASLPKLKNGVYIILQDNIAIPTLSLPELEELETGIALDQNSLLSTVSLPKFKRTKGTFTAAFALGVQVTNNAALTEFNALLLEEILGANDNLEIVTNPVLTKIDTPLLNKVEGQLYISGNPLLTTFNHALSVIGGDIIFQGNDSATGLTMDLITAANVSVTVSDNDLLQAISMVLLNTIGNTLYIENNAALVTVNLPSLGQINAGAGEIRIINNTVLANLSFPDAGVMLWNIHDNPALASININSLTVANQYQLYNNALSQVNVDAILAIADASGVMNGQMNLSGGTSATPSAAGLISAANLLGKGWGVAHN